MNTKLNLLENNMKHIYGSLLIAWLALEQIFNFNNDTLMIASVLGALCIFVIKEKYFDNIYASLLFLGFALFLVRFNNNFILLTGIVLIDFSYLRKYIAAGAIFIIVVSLCIFSGNYNYIFHLASAGIFGYIIGIKDIKEKKHISLLDEERDLRYRLERTQKELIKSEREVEQIAEIRERNRIAHEIHDNIGHSIAGVKFQLEAAIRILSRDTEKAQGILALCNKKLSEALELTRNTVYNIRVDKKIGIALIEQIIKEFKFCPVNFQYCGDFNNISASNMKILEATVKEVLTNASKYSKATNIEIKIDKKGRNIRFYYIDDGVGCSNIYENIGLSGIRERVRNIGGTTAIDGNAGFLIVCNIPTKNEEVEGEEL